MSQSTYKISNVKLVICNAFKFEITKTINKKMYLKQREKKLLSTFVMRM